MQTPQNCFHFILKLFNISKCFFLFWDSIQGGLDPEAYSLPTVPQSSDITGLIKIDLKILIDLYLPNKVWRFMQLSVSPS